MKNQRVIHPTGLRNDCGVIAAAAWQYLINHGVTARILHICYGKDDGHVIVIFESAGRLSTYDYDGSLVFDKGTTWEIKPKLLAKAWVKANGIKKVENGEWF